MPLDHDTARRLTNAQRAQLDRTSRHNLPTNLRATFGPRINWEANDPDAALPPPPKRDLARSLVEHAERCQRTWLAIHDSHYRSLADESTDERARYLRSAQSAKTHLAERDTEARALLDKVGEKVDHLTLRRSNLLKPPASVGDAVLDSEMRALIRAEPNVAKRQALIDSHPRAVASAPAMASGLGEKDTAYAGARDKYLRAADPDLADEFDELQASLDQFTRADEALSKFSRELIDFDMADQLAKGATWQAEG